MCLLLELFEAFIWAAISEAGNSNERILCSRGNSGTSEDTGEPGTVAMRLSSIPGGSLEKGRPGSLPGTTTVVDKHLGRRYARPLPPAQERVGTDTTGNTQRVIDPWQSKEGCCGCIQPTLVAGSSWWG